MRSMSGPRRGSDEGPRGRDTPACLSPPLHRRASRGEGSEPSSPSLASPLSPLTPGTPITPLFGASEGSARRRSFSAAAPSPPGPSTAGVQVYVRARPFVDRELRDDPRPIVTMNGGEVSLHDPKAGYKVRTKFQYTAALDSVFPNSEEFMTQRAVFDIVGKQILDNVLEGYNACLLAYGQTGSGKTHTMMGSLTGAEVGITPRLCAHLFARIAALRAQRPVSVTVEAAYCEIYNEKVKDLLAPKGKPGPNLRIRQHSRAGTVVEGLSSHPVTNTEAVVKLIQRGTERRATASTDLNDQSSRSHAVFTLHVTQIRIKARDTEHVQTKELHSVVHLVDLAGSERVKLSGAKGVHLEEAKNINLSLSTLGRVIEALIDSAAGKRAEPPYRESALTWMLRNTFGGNSKTIMIATVSPSASSFDETLSTLRYASRARQVVNRVSVNVKEETKLMAELQVEMESIRSQLQDVTTQEHEEQIEALTEQLRFHQQMVEEMHHRTEAARRQWESSERETEKRLESAAQEKERLQQQVEALEREHTQALQLRHEHVSRLQTELSEKERALKDLTESRIVEYNQRIAELEQQVFQLRAKDIVASDRVRLLQAESQVMRHEIRDLKHRLMERDLTIKILEQRATEAPSAPASPGGIADLQAERDRLDDSLQATTTRAMMAEARVTELAAEGRARDERINSLLREGMEASKRLAVLDCQVIRGELEQAHVSTALEEAKAELQKAAMQRLEAQRTRELDGERIRALEAELAFVRREAERRRKSTHESPEPPSELLARLKKTEIQAKASAERATKAEADAEFLRQQLKATDVRQDTVMASGAEAARAAAALRWRVTAVLEALWEQGRRDLQEGEREQRHSLRNRSAEAETTGRLREECLRLKDAQRHLEAEQSLTRAALRSAEDGRDAARHECAALAKTLEAERAALTIKVQELHASSTTLERLSEDLETQRTAVAALQQQVAAQQSDLQAKEAETAEFRRRFAERTEASEVSLQGLLVGSNPPSPEKGRILELQAQIAQLTDQLAARQEQIEALEDLNASMSAEYGSRLSRMIEDSPEFHRILDALAGGSSPKPDAEKSRSGLNFLFSRSASTVKTTDSPKPPARVVRPTATSTGTPSPSLRSQSPGAHRRSSLNRPTSSGWGHLSRSEPSVAFMDTSGDGEEGDQWEAEGLRLRTHIKVLENNLAAVKHVTVKLLAKHLTPAEGLRELLEALEADPSASPTAHDVDVY